MVTTLTNPILSVDQKEAAWYANDPSAINPYLTEIDGQNLPLTYNSSWTVGDIGDDYIVFYANTTPDAEKPALRYNKPKNRWEFSNDGETFYPFCICTGGVGGLTSFVHVQNLPSDMWNIQHNLAAGVIWTLTDSEHNIIQADEVQLIDESSMRVFFSEPVAGILYILSTEYTHEQTSASTIWDVTHSLNTYQIAYKILNDDGYEILPDSMKQLDTNTIRLTFGAAITGRVEMAVLGFSFENPAAAMNWSVIHSLGSRTIGYLITDNAKEQIEADNVKLTNDNTVDIEFLTNVDGYAYIIED